MKTTPKDFFLWAGAMVALYFSIGSFVVLSFEYIDRLFGPSSLIGSDPYSSGIRFAIASLIVLLPVYLWLTHLLQQDIRRHTLKKDIWVRRWLVFFTVFSAALALIIDLIVLINTFLGGNELTIAFLLKILAIIVIFGGVFYYYLNDIRGTWEHHEKLSRRIGIGVTLLVIVSIVAGFFIMGSPYTQRLIRYDAQRINDLKNIQSQITSYYRTTEQLPKTLSELKDPLVGNYIPTDPETNNFYEYKKVGTQSFSLCADFSLTLSKITVPPPTRNDWKLQELKRTSQNWAHSIGRTCFTRTIDPKRITPYKQPFPIR